MECHDVQQLLAFVNRPGAELDTAEQTVVREHLEKCPDCSAIAQAERGADDLIGPMLRDVPVPPGLQGRVKARLSADRSIARWQTAKRVGWAAAAVLMCALLGGTTWKYWAQPDVTVNDVDEFGERGGWTDEQVRDFFRRKGLIAEVPGEFSLENLRCMEVVEFKGKRVAKLSFQKELDNGQTAKADLVILPHRQFRIDKLDAQELHNVTSVRILHTDGYTYLIYYRTSLDVFLRVLN